MSHRRVQSLTENVGEETKLNYGMSKDALSLDNFKTFFFF